MHQPVEAYSFVPVEHVILPEFLAMGNGPIFEVPLQDGRIAVYCAKWLKGGRGLFKLEKIVSKAVANQARYLKPIPEGK